jgi:hypothetical protein
MMNGAALKFREAVVLCALLSALAIQDGLAETTVQLEANTVGITVYSLDDHITCRMNGVVVLKMDFGDPPGSADATRHLVQGANKLNCVVTDDDGGACYAYGYNVWTGVGQARPTVVHSSEASCCLDNGCLRPGNPVLDETVWFLKP